MNMTLREYSALFNVGEEDYSQEISEQIHEWADLARSEFLKSPHAGKLNETALQNLYLISVLAELAYSYHLTKPGHWTDLEIRDVCCNLIPQKLIAPIVTFEMLPAIFDTFFEWGEEIGIFQDTKSWRFTLEKYKSEILTNAEIPDNWELSKSLILESQNEDDEITNEDYT